MSSGEEVLCLLFLSGEGQTLVFCIGLSYLYGPVMSMFTWLVTESLFY